MSLLPPDYVTIQLTHLRFVADMKLAHYLHIAPRTLFLAQGLATLVGAIVQCGVTVFMITRIDGVCTSDAEGNFTCPHGRVTYSSSLIWGNIIPPISSAHPGVFPILGYMLTIHQVLLAQVDCSLPVRRTAIYSGSSSWARSW